MDPSAFNSSRIGNAWGALDDWRHGRKKRPFSMWGAIIVVIILVGMLVFVFHNPSPRNNFSVLDKVPKGQVQQVKSTIKKFNFGINFPTELPFTPTHVRATLLNQSKGIQIDFSNSQNTVEEQITTNLTSVTPLQNKTNVTLPNAYSAATGTDGHYPELVWSSGHMSYTLVVIHWNSVNPPSITQLIGVYRHITTVYP